jgi:Fe-S-cluster-containing dehydrogenase component/anaerobic selenocysteine-containing dehydrogenase
MPKISRRTFLWFTGGSSLALATNPPRKLVNKLIPKVIPPEDILPGTWEMFATTCRECPAGCGMHLWQRDGRVTKAEGNPAHPVNLGGLCPRGQSSLQGLYDPDRVQQPLYRVQGRQPQKASWGDALTAIAAKLSAGGRVAVLSSLQTGALAEVMRSFAGAFGSKRVLFYEAFNYEPLKAAHQQLFNMPVVPSYRLDNSDFILSFGADFLESWISPVSFASQFADMHAYQGGGKMNRMAYVGPRLSLTAANADTFVQVPPGYERVVAASMLKIIIERGWQKKDLSSVKGAVDALVAGAGPIPGVTDDMLLRLATSFSSAKSGVALAGPLAATGAAATDTALCAALLNFAVGALGRNVDFSHPHALTHTAREAELQSFFDSLGPDDILFVHDTNPAYSRLGAAPQLSRAGTLVYLGTLLDETAQLAQWFLTTDSPLESWGDYEPQAGIQSLMQPTMNRLYDSRSAGDVFLELARRAGKPLTRPGAPTPPTDFAAWLRLRWNGLSGRGGSDLLDKSWTEALRNGGAWKTTPEGNPGAPAPPGIGSVSFSAATNWAPAKADEAQFWPWPSIMSFDGRLANRGWLQEAPDPITFLVWGNWIDLHPRKAAALKLEAGDIAELTTAAGSLRAPVRITEEVSEHLVAIAFGQGHQAMGQTARGVGANAFALLGAAPEGSTFAACRIRRVRPEPGSALLVPSPTAPTREQLGREVVQWVPLSELAAMKPGAGDRLELPLPEGYRPEHDMYPKHEHPKHRWAMVVDLQRCIGCGACAVACYAENNIAVIGREHVGKGREMAWLRVAPYRKPGNTMRYSWLPLLCQHCDAAPCEPVCPVFAAMHNEEGLNAQIYNRCIGTRYCSNNCPYKVRRFNWINIEWKKPLDLQLNPEVTVRTRGVMEKCTFCVQRIRQAEYRALREKRTIRDGEIQPACAQSCPTRVYTFGDLLDPNSQVSKLTRSDPRRYHVLEELNTKPAVTFLRRVDIDTEKG